MKKLLLIACLLGPIGSARAMDGEAFEAECFKLLQDIGEGRLTVPQELAYSKEELNNPIEMFFGATFFQVLLSTMNSKNVDAVRRKNIRNFLVALIKEDKIVHSRPLVVGVPGFQGEQFLQSYFDILSDVGNPLALPAQNPRLDVLYQKDGVVITQRDITAFGNRTFTKQRFDELYDTMSVIVPALQGKNYTDYLNLPDWKRSLGAGMLKDAVKQLGTQGQQPAPSAPSPPPASTTSTPALQPQPAVAAPHVTPAKKPVPAPAPVQRPASTAPKSTVIIDTKYAIGAIGVVVVAWIAYKWYEAWCQDNEKEDK